MRKRGHSYKEAAKILSLTPKTIENQLRIATKKIFSDLEPYFQDIKTRAEELAQKKINNSQRGFINDNIDNNN